MIIVKLALGVIRGDIKQVRSSSKLTGLLRDYRSFSIDGYVSNSGGNECVVSSEKDLSHKEELTYLGRNFTSMIKINGPLSLYDFMKLSTSGPLESYYSKPEVFGTHGDFVTSPEISQVFGELLGLWYLTQWEKAGKPTKVQVIEFGPGKGTLMSDMLRTWRKFPEFYSALSNISLVEASEPLARIQAASLAPNVDLDHLSPLPSSPPLKPFLPQGLLDSPGLKLDEKISIKWFSHPDYVFEEKNQLLESWKIVLAHEFFDALPIYKFTRTASGWREIMVDIDTSHESPHRFTYFESPVSTRASKILSHQLENPEYSSLDSLEFAPEAFRIANQIGVLLSRSAGGSALLVDYGEDFPQGNTLRGIRNHQFCHPLSYPGKTDISANVDFSLLRDSITNCLDSTYFTNLKEPEKFNPDYDLNIHGPVLQEVFLHNMGIQSRFQLLLNSYAKKNKQSTLSGLSADLEEVKQSLESAYRRLTDHKEMGKLYKVLGVTTSPKE